MQITTAYTKANNTAPNNIYFLLTAGVGTGFSSAVTFCAGCSDCSAPSQVKSS